MAKDPAFLFYPSDFLTGVVFMTDEEVGKYIKILCLLHQHSGKLERKKIEKVVGILSESIIEKLDSDGNGCLFNKRLLLETEKRNAYCESRRKNIQERYKKPTYVKHMNKHMENRNRNRNKDVNKDNTIGDVLIKFPYIKDKDFVDVFESYLKNRKTKATDRAKELILKDLHKYSKEIAVAMLEQSIKNGWIGIFELKKESGYGTDKNNTGKGSEYAGLETEIKV